MTTPGISPGCLAPCLVVKPGHAVPPFLRRCRPCCGTSWPSCRGRGRRSGRGASFSGACRPRSLRRRRTPRGRGRRGPEERAAAAISGGWLKEAKPLAWPVCLLEIFRKMRLCRIPVTVVADQKEEGHAADRETIRLLFTCVGIKPGHFKSIDLKPLFKKPNVSTPPSLSLLGLLLFLVLDVPHGAALDNLWGSSHSCSPNA